MFDNPMKLNGFDLIIKEPQRVKERRTLKERFFSLPWKPFVKYRYKFVDIVKDGEVIRSGQTLIMNQKTYNAMMRSLHEKR